ncbi:DUF4147 domain-containing protein [Patescibacteria group bacterium]|nr:DUF4147 domain-containing protein [Patescibacteria group bacterium]
MPKPLITNFKTLAATKLRRDALNIWTAGVQAVETQKVIRSAVKRQGNTLTIGRKKYQLNDYQRIYLVGIGKASFDAALALEKILKSKIKGGVVLCTVPGELQYAQCVTGTHPLPSAVNVRATAQIVSLLKQADSQDLIITVVSGGGSALLCQPYQITCDQVSRITQLLMKKGATIRELNTARKHLSEIQGGQFVRLAHPATVISLIFSDVPGDNLDEIASGPTVLDKTTAHDAARILQKYNVLNECRLPHCQVLETPKDKKLFKNVHNELLVTNKLAIQAMARKAEQLGYQPKILSAKLQGEARLIGKKLAQAVKPGQALIAGGETTVLVKNGGQGGRNQEVALGALEHLPANALVLSGASDGIDNSPVAGALVDGLVQQKAEKKTTFGRGLSKGQ